MKQKNTMKTKDLLVICGMGSMALCGGCHTKTTADKYARFTDEDKYIQSHRVITFISMSMVVGASHIRCQMRNHALARLI